MKNEKNGKILDTGVIPMVTTKDLGAVMTRDIYSYFLSQRIIFVGDPDGVFTTSSADLLIAQLLFLDQQDEEKDISLHINSPGGLVTAGLAVYDTMQYIKSPISTICMGMAMSFGAVILAAGTKGRRIALPNSRIMIHQPLIMGGGISGQATDIEIEAKEMQISKRILTQIIADHTGKTFDEVHKDMERNYYMSAEEAKEYGLVDIVSKVVKR